MEGFLYFFEILVLFAPFLFPFVGIPLFVIWLIFVVLSIRELWKKEFKFPIRLFRYLIPLAFIFVSMFALAAYFQNDFFYFEDDSPGSIGNLLLLLVNLLVIIYAIVKEKEWRMTLIAAGLVLALISVNMYFLTEMSITGTWL